MRANRWSTLSYEVVDFTSAAADDMFMVCVSLKMLFVLLTPIYYVYLVPGMLF